MKICLISDRNIYMQRLCTALTDHGYSVSLICRHRYGIPENQFPAGIQFYQLTSQSMLLKFKEIRSFLNKVNPDIVHLHYLARDAIIPVLKITRKYRYIISVWGSDLNIYSKHLSNRIIQSLALHFCDKVHINNAIYKDKISKLYLIRKFQKFALISWGIDSRFIHARVKDSPPAVLKQYSLNPDSKLILSYRNHKRVYNHKTLILAIPDIISRFPEAKFLFTRGSCDEEYVRENLQLVKQLKISEHFIYIDEWLDTEDLIQLVKTVDINVNIPFSDGLPASLFEMMSSSAVPVTGKLDNYLDFFQNNFNGFYLNDINSYKELAKIIINTLGSLDQYKKKFYKNNISYVTKSQNWDTQSELFINVYKSLE